MTFPTTYEDFLKSDGCVPSHESDESARKVWGVLARPDNVAKMIAMATIGEPPLLVCAAEVEKMSTSDEFDVRGEHSPKQFAGRMVSVILAPYGYEPRKTEGDNYVSRDFPKSIGSGTIFVREG